jgi:acetylornithine deacetylase/succinyl-diaminopimelate desuccinylase-like protein
MGKRHTTKTTDLTIGATDCKNNLLGILDAFEFLLENNFRPKRTILAGFGFDEEIRFIFILCF